MAKKEAEIVKEAVKVAVNKIEEDIHNLSIKKKKGFRGLRKGETL